MGAPPRFRIFLFAAVVSQMILSSEFLTTHFVDGLMEEIRTVVAIQRPKDLDTACSRAILQEEVLAHSSRRDGRRVEGNSFVSYCFTSAPLHHLGHFRSLLLKTRTLL